MVTRTGAAAWPYGDAAVSAHRGVALDELLAAFHSDPETDRARAFRPVGTRGPGVR